MYVGVQVQILGQTWTDVGYGIWPFPVTQPLQKERVAEIGRAILAAKPNALLPLWGPVTLMMTLSLVPGHAMDGTVRVHVDALATAVRMDDKRWFRWEPRQHEEEGKGVENGKGA